jgi:hypothetical protein
VNTAHKLAPAGIPTIYRGIWFRSRLEAKWAAFFDNLGWRWDYEPFDLNGYIPDFVLDFPHRPMLVEVKPAMYVKDYCAPTSKVQRSGWADDALIVGARIFDDPACVSEPAIGWLSQRERIEECREWDWGFGILFWCLHCRRLSIRHDHGHWECRINGCYDHGHHIGVLEKHEDIEGRWAQACNTVQWRPR